MATHTTLSIAISAHHVIPTRQPRAVDPSWYLTIPMVSSQCIAPLCHDSSCCRGKKLHLHLHVTLVIRRQTAFYSIIPPCVSPMINRVSIPTIPLKSHCRPPSVTASPLSRHTAPSPRHRTRDDPYEKRDLEAFQRALRRAFIVLV